MRDRVGIVGLGVMGLPMARNLRQAGFHVAGWARSAERANQAAGEGVAMRESVRDLAASVDIMITMVTSSEDVLEVCLGEGALLASASAGSVLVDMSTIAPDTSRRVAAEAASRGIGFLDAPVSGGLVGAEEGTLTIMVGGEVSLLERCRPVFEAVGDPARIFYMGAVGSGEVVKLVNNMLVGSISAATIEALLVGVRCGIPLKTLVDVVSASSGASFQLSGQLSKRALAGDLRPGFSTDLLVKDLQLAARLAREAGQETPLTDAARALFEASQAAGRGKQDYTALALELSADLAAPLRIE